MRTNFLDDATVETQRMTPESSYLSSQNTSNKDTSSSIDYCSDENEDSMITESIVDSEDSFANREPGIRDDSLGEYYPFESKVHALLFTLLHIPSTPVSKKFAKFLWFVFQQLGVHVPSLNSILKCEKLWRPAVIKSRGRASKSIYYRINVSEIVQMELANPQVSSLLWKLPPQCTANTLSSVWQAAKWRTSSTFHTPVINANNRHYWIHDFVHFQNSVLYISEFYVNELGVLLVKAYSCIRLPDQPPHCIFIDFTFHLTIKAHDLGPIANIQPVGYIELQSFETPTIVWNLERNGYNLLSPHLLKARSIGRKVVNIPLILFSDETSANQSKKWNLFEVWYAKLAGIPWSHSQYSTVHFICGSQTVKPWEMADGILDDLQNGLEKGMITFDAALQEQVLLIGGVLFIKADNPRAAELCSMTGLTSNNFCRCCHSKPDTVMMINTTRCAEVTKLNLKAVSDKVEEGLSTKAIADFQKATGLKYRAFPYPPFEFAGFDPHRDIPIEILHTLLLGPWKYFTKRIVSRIGQSEKWKLQAEVASFNWAAYPRSLSGRVLANYYGSMVGRDYKLIAQVAPFIFNNFCTSKELSILIILSELTNMLYVSSITNVQFYMWRLKALLDDFLREVNNLDERLLAKRKFHLLLHAPQHIERFGPLINCCTESEEAFNSKVRLNTLFQNRQALSRDTATQFATYTGLRHVFMGGWFSSTNRTWIQSGAKMQELSQQKEIVDMLQLPQTSTPSPHTPSHFARDPRSRRHIEHRVIDLALDSLNQVITSQMNFQSLDHLRIVYCERVSDINGAKGCIGDWIELFENDDQRPSQHVGRLENILAVYDDDRAVGCVVNVRLYNKVIDVSRLHAHGYQKITRTERLEWHPISKIGRFLDVQHDCASKQCNEFVECRGSIREREVVDALTTYTKKHSDDVNFVINRFKFGHTRY